jgi:FlaA1/EpsC-like NDP-sugar epimerase/dTDP-4-amino-4,6-dideoxygalactose transaminase
MIELLLALLLDVVAVNLAMLVVFLFRFLGQIPPDYWSVFLLMALPYTVLSLAVNSLVGVYRHSPRSLVPGDLLRIVLSTVLVTALFGAASFLLPFYRLYPRSILVLVALVAPFFVGGWRLALHALEQRRKRAPIPSPRGKTSLIVGAGTAGQSLARAALTDPEARFNPIGFADDDPDLVGRSFQGLPLLGTVEETAKLIHEQKIEQILIADPSGDPSVRERLLAFCLVPPAQTFILTLPDGNLGEEVALSMLHAPTLENLIGRVPIALDEPAVASYLSGQRVLVTGASSAIGRALTREIAPMNPQLLILLGTDEDMIHEVDLELSLSFPELKRQVVIGDVRDAAKMEKLFREYLPAIVFHAAAHRQFFYTEFFPEEAVKDNVIGTKNLALLAAGYGVRKFIFVSTDQAAYPTSASGATKRVAEEILESMEKKYQTQYLTIRTGNVLGAKGGILDNLEKQLEYGNIVTISHPEARRRFVMPADAARLLIQAGTMESHQGTYQSTFDRPFRVSELVDRYLRWKGKQPGKDVRLVYTGLQPGEEIDYSLPEVNPSLEPSPIRGLQRVTHLSERKKDFPILLAQLERVATEGRGDKVVEVLQRLVPDYAPQRDFSVPRLVDAAHASPRIRPLGEIALELGLLDQETLYRAIGEQKTMAERGRKPLGQILLESGTIDASNLEEILKTQEQETEASKGILAETPSFTKLLPIVQPTLPALSDVGKDFSQIMMDGILTKGKYVGTFERDVAATLGVPYAVALSSCTLGLILVCSALGLRGEVIVPSFTFSATVHALAWNGLTPVFTDCLPDELTIDPEQVERLITERTAAIMAVHVFGNPARIDTLEEIASRHRIPLIFDSAHGFGTLYRGKPVGGHGQAEVFSTSPTKLLITGEGGVVTTHDKDLATRLTVLREYGNPGNYDSIYPGVNARMAEINALLGIRGLPQVEANAARRNELVALYHERLANVPGIRFQVINPLGRSSYKDFPILVDKERFGLDRDQLFSALARENIQTKKYYSPPLHLQTAYTQYRELYRGLLPVTEQVSAEALSLPIHSHMEEETVVKVSSVIAAMHERAPTIRELLKDHQELH